MEQWPYRAIAKSLEVIPRTLIQNCGANTIRTITALRVCLPIYATSINDVGCFYPNLSNLLKEIFEISCKAVMLFVGHKMVTCVAETREMCRNNQGVKSMTKRSHDG